jgi:hypothetical protein
MSCGGHKKPRVKSSQVPENEFYIEFGFTTRSPTRKSWQSLNEIACSISEGEIWEWHGMQAEQWVKIALCKDDSTTVYFRLYGRNVDPNDILSRMVERQKQTPSDYFKNLKPSKPYGYFSSMPTLKAEEINQILAEDTGDE